MTNRAEPVLPRAKASVIQGLEKGWSGLLWLLKIIVPISFATALLVHFGLIYKLDFVLTPVMKMIGLPASAALVIVVGLFTGIYGTVAALSVMAFSQEHMILIAIFTLISHNIIQESLVQGRSGLNMGVAIVFRTVMALLVTWICARMLGITAGESGGTAAGLALSDPVAFPAMVRQWAWETAMLSVQILCIIMPLMVVMELARTFNVITILTRLTSPVLKIMGLSRSTGMLWLTAAIFGLAYGAAVIVEETRSREYDREELTRLQLSVGINHAMIEDPALFLPLGLPAFWLWVPRLLAAIAAAWLHLGFCFARRLYAQRAGHKKLCNH